MLLFPEMCRYTPLRVQNNSAFMPQCARIIQTLKSELKQRGITYSALAGDLSLSESAVKQMFASGDMSLSRLDRVCEILSMDIGDLINTMEKDNQQLRSLSLEQEEELVSNPKLLLVAYCLVNHWRFEDVLSKYDIAETEAIQIAAHLDRMKLIELLPGNRAKPLVATNFDWQPDGPIEQYFRREVQGPFFDDSFKGDACIRLAKFGDISVAGRQTLAERLTVLGQHFDDLVVDERKLPLDQREGATMVVAIRNWEFEAFAQFRREDSQ